MKHQSLIPIVLLAAFPFCAKAETVSAEVCKGKATYFIAPTELPLTYAAASEIDDYANNHHDNYGRILVNDKLKKLLIKTYDTLIEEIPSVPANVENYIRVSDELNSKYNQISICLELLNVKNKDKSAIDFQLEKYLLKNVATMDQAAIAFINEVNNSREISRKIMLFQKIMQNPEKNAKFLSSDPIIKANFELHLEILNAQLDGVFATARDEGLIPKNSKCFVKDHEAIPLTDYEFTKTYPNFAQEIGLSGKVQIEREIDETGSVTSVKFKNATQTVFASEKLLAAAKQTRFLPKFEDCRPIKSSFSSFVIFSIKD